MSNREKSTPQTSPEQGAARFSLAWHAYFDPRTEPGEGGCVLWTRCLTNLGYASHGPMHGFVRGHRLAYLLHYGVSPKGSCVLHRCDVRNCVNPLHLFLGTQRDNIADMHAKGRNRNPIPRHGEANPMSRLTAETVREIRHACQTWGVSQAEVARRMGVSTMTVSRIVRRQLWGSVR